jgi:hypothetical protein
MPLIYNEERFRARSDITAKPRSYVSELDFPTGKGMTRREWRAFSF